MYAKTRILTRLGSLAAIIAVISLSVVRAQDATLEEIKYKEDYDRVQAILKVSDIQKRSDRLIALYKERPDMRDDLRAYVDSLFVRDLDNLMKAQNFILMGSICDRTLKVRPKFGEVWLYQGVVLKNAKKNDEAMLAFAKCYVITNQFKQRGKQQLDVLYRAANGGSLIGQEKIIKQAVKELNSR
jgi:hypothetical protein